MTREEAIKELEEDKALYMPEEWIESLDRDTPDGRLITALDMAIKALEQELCDDCISRQAVTDIICDGISCNECSFNTCEDGQPGCLLKERVEKLPSVTSQPKTGRWIYTLEDWNKWECSECGFTKRTDVHVNIGYKYCPECGARMIRWWKNEGIIYTRYNSGNVQKWMP